MNRTIVFLHVQGKPEVLEVEITLPATFGQLFDSLKRLGIELGEDLNLFIDECEHHEKRDHNHEILDLKHGCRVHVTRCRKIKVTVHFLDKTIDYAFPPGTRVRAVKQWAVREFKISATDAGEHVLQLCNSTKQPPTDAPLTEITHEHSCEVCFDLVPEKRVEG